VTHEAVLAEVRREIGEGPGRPDRAALASLGIDLDEVRRTIQEAFGSGALESTAAWQRGEALPLCRRAKKVLHLALREALTLGHRRVGPEHILLAILREGGGVAAEIIRRRAGSVDRIRATILGELRLTA
jgi:ATP-dependent Clp protease ATP-binding subunit ClpA